MTTHHHRRILAEVRARKAAEKEVVAQNHARELCIKLGMERQERIAALEAELDRAHAMIRRILAATEPRSDWQMEAEDIIGEHEPEERECPHGIPEFSPCDHCNRDAGGI